MTTPANLMPAGPYAACITPFNKDGSLDEAALREHMAQLAKHGAGLFLGASHTGEGPLLELSEHRRIFEIARDALGDQVPLYAANIEYPSADGVLAIAGVARETGMDALQIYPPGLRATVPLDTNSLRAFYDQVLSSLDQPVILSSNFLSGYEAPPAMHAEFADTYPHVIGYTKHHPSIDSVAEFLHAIDGRRPVLSGGWNGFMAHLLNPINGEMNPMVNVVPASYQHMFTLMADGDHAGAARVSHQISRLGRSLHRFGVQGIKSAINLLGRPGGHPRLPYLALDGPDLDDVRAALAASDLEEVHAH
ncbi:MAG TPA: dihydrodipicolinate synthase family protein [Actinophytocola sp.]|nr:dihydrodipicolinate synthase family protein [Actinophytocola sp.]